MLPLRENVASDSVFNRLVLLFWAKLLLESVYEAPKKEGKMNKTDIENEKNKKQKNHLWFVWKRM